MVHLTPQSYLMLVASYFSINKIQIMFYIVLLSLKLEIKSKNFAKQYNR